MGVCRNTIHVYCIENPIVSHPIAYAIEICYLAENNMISTKMKSNFSSQNIFTSCLYFASTERYVKASVVAIH